MVCLINILYLKKMLQRCDEKLNEKIEDLWRKREKNLARTVLYCFLQGLCNLRLLAVAPPTRRLLIADLFLQKVNRLPNSIANDMSVGVPLGICRLYLSALVSTSTFLFAITKTSSFSRFFQIKQKLEPKLIFMLSNLYRTILQKDFLI